VGLQTKLQAQPVMVNKSVNCDEPELLGRAISARTQEMADINSVGLSAKSIGRPD